MSQDDQRRNQPNEDPAEAARRRAQAEAARRDTGTGSGISAGAGAVAAEHQTTPRREFHDPGEGAPRYAAVGEQIPRSGSEQSWSAAPHPGYQPDPALNYSSKRLLASTLIGILLLGGGVVYVYRIVSNRSGNGFGGAPWTAAVKHDGAYVGGINAQNDGAAQPVDLPQGVSPGSSGNAGAAAVGNAIATCRAATATTIPVTTATGTTATIGDWAVRATPSVQILRSDAATLQTALTLGHVAAVANAANTLCTTIPHLGGLPPMPDAAGSQAWSSAISAFSTAATESLQGASGNPDATAAAFDGLNEGDMQLNALSARIAAAT
ncbi:hypothetical protein KGQ19_30680 [Catenulispora sp. NL8]|uniref:Uncharacterized protein n=1 Tax=Catenulispora pinistramenti TaxID=2705254 RepID=A0ABS5KYW8_9ACTN|nr:hypothetical protein [Catenulispora pinistramenti]MBS2551244.1 hypothetical protein [Catenulispora pinistramenti]